MGFSEQFVCWLIVFPVHSVGFKLYNTSMSPIKLLNLLQMHVMLFRFIKCPCCKLYLCSLILTLNGLQVFSICSVPHSHGILLTHCDQFNLSLSSFIFLKKLPRVYFVLKTALILSSSSSLTYGPYSLISTSRKIGHRDLSYAFFLHIVTLINFRSFLTRSKHLNLGHSSLHRNNFFTLLLSEILTRLVHSSLLPIFVTVFGFLYLICSSSLVCILQPF
jgi:hypothetical protein